MNRFEEYMLDIPGANQVPDTKKVIGPAVPDRLKSKVKTEKLSTLEAIQRIQDIKSTVKSEPNALGGLTGNILKN